MTMLQLPARAQAGRLALTIDDVNVDLQGPGDVIAIVSSILRRHRRTTGRADDIVRGLTIRLTRSDDTVAACGRSAVQRIIQAVAEIRSRHVVRAAALERGGRALVIAGPPGCGRSTLAAHFLSRGWSLVADDLTVLSDDGTTVVRNHALMSLAATSVPHLPLQFREALERSRWCVDAAKELRFYEVDPGTVFGARAWSDGARLDAVVFLTGAAEDCGVETLHRARGAELFASVAAKVPDCANVRIGATALGRSSRCAESIECWYEAHATP